MHYWFLIKTIIIITIIIIKYANSVSQFLEKSKFCQDPPPLPPRSEDWQVERGFSAVIG